MRHKGVSDTLIGGAYSAVPQMRAEDNRSAINILLDGTSVFRVVSSGGGIRKFPGGNCLYQRRE
ncbi:MAG: hypothetical protein AABY40_01655 [Nanoarchaeota archaeon]